jgi:hypothetical protein
VTVCRYFRTVWENSERLLPRGGAWGLGHYQDMTDFRRIETYLRKEPPIASQVPCKCGECDDAWRHWNHTRRHVVLGQR